MEEKPEGDFIWQNIGRNFYKENSENKMVQCQKCDHHQ